MTTETLSLKTPSPSETSQGESKMAFEGGIKRLEAIVSRLEEGQISLEASVALYEEGVALKKNLQAQLEQAKLRVEQISCASGDIKEAPLDTRT